MRKPKKTWKKNTRIIRDVGLCKYCNKMIVSDEAFVIFATKEPAHYLCMKKSLLQQGQTQFPKFEMPMPVF